MAEGCFPVSNDNFYMVGANRSCKDGFGWLKKGECGCREGAPGWKPELGGCSVRCTGPGETECGMWCGLSNTTKYAIYGAGALLALGAVFMLTAPRAAPPAPRLQGIGNLLTGPKRKKRKSRSKRR